MKLKKLFNDRKKCKHLKKDRHVKPTVEFYIDTSNYDFAFLPTVLYIPWVYRMPDSEGVVDIWWLNCHILIGTECRGPRKEKK